MSTYAIGDVQGCYKELQQLLEKIQFNPANDRLWFTGDLVNRGPKSLETLRFVKSLGDKAITVLGNHDLHFIAVVENLDKIKSKDSFDVLLKAEDCKSLSDWLRTKPLIHHDDHLRYTLIHAGLSPDWDLSLALALADEVHQILISSHYRDFLSNMYGNEPDHWDPCLQGWDRLRVITNYFTRTRYLDLKGRLDLNYKGSDEQYRPGYYPWFALKDRQSKSLNIVFGHWASLLGKTKTNNNVYGLDTGCCWGNCLTAMRLEDRALFQVKCAAYQAVQLDK